MIIYRCPLCNGMLKKTDGQYICSECYYVLTTLPNGVCSRCGTMVNEGVTVCPECERRDREARQKAQMAASEAARAAKRADEVLAQTTEPVKKKYKKSGKSGVNIPLLIVAFLLLAFLAFRFNNNRKYNVVNSTIKGISVSYGYIDEPHAPNFEVSLDGKTLVSGEDYSFVFTDNIFPGTATLKITGQGKYHGTKEKTFEILECATYLTSGATYMLIPKNAPQMAVCAVDEKMTKNTNLCIAEQSDSESMKFKALQQADGTWKFYNAKCELVMAVQQNKSEAGKKMVLYNETQRDAQKWELVKKRDDSYAIINSVSGLSVSLFDKEAEEGTLLSIEETASSGFQRFYFQKVDPVEAPYSNGYYVKSYVDNTLALSIPSLSVEDGEAVLLENFKNISSQMFSFRYSGDGYYRIENANSGLVITAGEDDNLNKFIENLGVKQREWTGQASQRWMVREDSEGTVTIINELGKALQLNIYLTNQLATVRIGEPDSSDEQRWYLID